METDIATKSRYDYFLEHILPSLSIRIEFRQLKQVHIEYAVTASTSTFSNTLEKVDYGANTSSVDMFLTMSGRPAYIAHLTHAAMNNPDLDWNLQRKITNMGLCILNAMGPFFGIRDITGHFQSNDFALEMEKILDNQEYQKIVQKAIEDSKPSLQGAINCIKQHSISIENRSRKAAVTRAKKKLLKYIEEVDPSFEELQHMWNEVQIRKVQSA